MRVLTDEEAKAVMEAFEAFKVFHGVVLNAVPFYTMDGRTECQARFFKVEESPKVEVGEGTNGKESKG